MIKKFLYILSIFAAVLLFDSCTKESIHKCDGEIDFFEIDADTDNSRGLVDQGGGGNINDHDDDDEEDDEDDEEIGDHDDDDEEDDEDNNVEEENDNREEGA